MAAFFNALSWIVLIPIWQYPDEQAHFAQVQTIAEFGTISFLDPNTSLEIDFTENVFGTQRDESGNNKHTYHPEFRIAYSDNYYGPQESKIANLSKSARIQLVKNEATVNPPLYYFLWSLTYQLFTNGSLFTRVYAVRFISLIFFLATIFLSYQFAKIVFEKSQILQIALPTLVAFKPMLIFSSTGVLPDSLTNLLFTAVLLLSLKVLKIGFKLRYGVILGLLVVLGTLTRQQFLISFFIIAFPIFYLIFKNYSHIKLYFSFLISIVTFSSLFLINRFGTSIPIISNFRLHELTLSDLRFSSQIGFDPIIWSFKHTLAQTLPWYWGVYKWLSLTLPPVTYQIINRLLAIGLIGVLLKLIDIFRNQKKSQDIRLILFLIYSSIVYFLILIIWDYFFYLKYGYHFGIQGRYFFPLVVFHIAILVIGIWQVFELVFKKYARYGLSIVLFLMVLFNDISLFYVAASYYDTSSFNRFIIQASQYKPEIFKGTILVFILSSTILLQAILFFKLTKTFLKTDLAEEKIR